MFYLKHVSKDRWIAGFDCQHRIVQQTNDIKLARVFTTYDEAARFLESYADAGYGLIGADYQVCRHAKEVQR